MSLGETAAPSLGQGRRLAASGRRVAASARPTVATARPEAPPPFGKCVTIGRQQSDRPVPTCQNGAIFGAIQSMTGISEVWRRRQPSGKRRRREAAHYCCGNDDVSPGGQVVIYYLHLSTEVKENQYQEPLGHSCYYLQLSDVTLYMMSRLN